VVFYYLTKVKGWLMIIKGWRDFKVRPYIILTICRTFLTGATWCAAHTISDIKKSLFVWRSILLLLPSSC